MASSRSANLLPGRLSMLDDASTLASIHSHRLAVVSAEIVEFVQGGDVDLCRGGSRVLAAASALVQAHFVASSSSKCVRHTLRLSE